MTKEAELAVADADEILRVIEDDVADRTKAKNVEYFESVAERTEGIKETVSRTGTATAAQRSALANMLAGVKKWVRGGRADE